MVKIKAIGLMAEALEHEIDHLDGRLYSDRIEKTESLHRTAPTSQQNEREVINENGR